MSGDSRRTLGQTHAARVADVNASAAAVMAVPDPVFDAPSAPSVDSLSQAAGKADFGLIPLSPASAGAFAVVDIEDYERLGHRGWHLRSFGDLSYATARIGCKTVLMHRVILAARRGEEIDHRNGDGLDNRRSNIRFATSAQNKANRRKYSRECVSRFKGVRRDPRYTRRPWVAIINSTYLGCFDNEEAAARAYDAAAIAKYGEFALPNFNQEAR